jgi:hypothetical protein
MTKNQDADPIISALWRMIDSIEGNSVRRRRYQTAELIFDFPINSAALLPRHEEHLAFLQEWMLEQDASVVSIIGHASQTGPESNNASLSLNRAETVRAYLMAANFPPSRVGPTVASGSDVPLVNVPGREAAVNRSVELLLDWEEVVKENPPPSAQAATKWELSFSVTFGAGVIIGGQILFGTLTKVTAEGVRVAKPVNAFIVGYDIGKSVGVAAYADLPIPAPFEEGKFTMRDPVDFDWFDGRPVYIASMGASFITGAAVTNVTFLDPSGRNVPEPIAAFVDHPLGVSIGVGVTAMHGILNVFD